MHRRNRNPRKPGPAQERPHIPMGDHRYQELMSKLGAAFAQADDGEERRQQAREKERQRQDWLARREMVISEILAAMREHGLSAQDLA